MPVAIPSKKALVLNLKDPSRVTAVIPKYEFINSNGIVYLAVPHTTDAWHILRNLGINVKGYEPMRSYYHYPKLSGIYEPMDHQRETAVFCATHKRCYVLNTMRTGKTASTLWAADFLRRSKQVKRTLILCTMSCMVKVWKNAIWSLFPDARVNVLHGSAETRIKLLDRDAEYYVINHDGIKTIEKQLTLAIKHGFIDLIINDEGAEFRNAGTDKYKVLYRVAKGCPRIWWLTGTPTPRSPEDAWAQCKIVTPETTPPTFKSWQDSVMFRVSQFKWVPRHDSDAKVHALMQPAIRFRKEDVIDVMPVTFEEREAPLTTEQKHVFDEIKKQGAIRSANGTISAVNKGVLLQKLIQISMGVVRADDGTEVLYKPKPRLAVVREIVEQAEGKVIVFAPFHAVVDMLVREIKEYTTVDFIDGRVSGTARDKVITEFQEREHLRVLVAHPRTTGHGLELAAANTIIWFGPIFSPDYYEQANHRVQSGQQKHSIGIYHIGATSMEWKYYGILRNSVNAQQKMLDLYNEVVGTT